MEQRLHNDKKVKAQYSINSEVGDIVCDPLEGINYMLLKLQDKWWENTREYKETYTALDLETGDKTQISKSYVDFNCIRLA